MRRIKFHVSSRTTVLGSALDYVYTVCPPVSLFGFRPLFKWGTRTVLKFTPPETNQTNLLAKTNHNLPMNQVYMVWFEVV